jgi:hypothetical protein
VDEHRDETPKHPAAHRLDALAAGDADADATAHLATCAACEQYVRASREQAAAFRAKSDSRAFVARASARTSVPARSPVVRIAWVAAPVLAAAAVLLLMRPRATDGTPVRGPTTGVTTTTAAPGESRFKGGLVVAVIRERGGAQERLTGPVRVRANDRLRVEVSTDHDGPLAAGLLLDQGDWAPLLAPAAVEAGTHFSELDARFDDSPTQATLLVGEPAAVDRARVTRDFGDVVAVRVTSEAIP